MIKNKILFLILILSAVFNASVVFSQNDNLKLTAIAKDLSAPLFATAAKNDARLFIVQQHGVISVFENGKIYDVLDISEQVTYAGEAGMLGLALHPDFLSNGLAYVSYTTGRLLSVIEEYRFDKVSNSFDIDSAREVYTLKQPAGNHNGGMVAFGPKGYLYIGFGDGGGSNDTYKHGQNFDTALGTIVRILVGDGVKQPYEIPFSNPNMSSAAPEAWVYGLRNPWRFSFDGNLLYIADVGQKGQEEISVIEVVAASSDDKPIGATSIAPSSLSSSSRSANFGWPLAEGDQCLFDKKCKEKDLIWPIKTYPTSEGCSITGGYVYRGKALPELNGHYFYGDFCSGKIFSLKYENGNVLQEKNWSDILGEVSSLSSFAVDGFGELYIISLGGTIYKLERNK